MKRIIISLFLECLVLAMAVCSAVAETNTGKDMSNKGIIYLNGVEVNSSNSIIKYGTDISIPLRSVLEGLGSEVIWEESTGNIYFDYASVDYVCKFVALNSYFPEDKSLLVCKIENMDSIKTKDYIQLNSWGAGGAFYMINDRTYLSQETGIRLLEALGCKVDIDVEANTLSISNR